MLNFHFHKYNSFISAYEGQQYLNSFTSLLQHNSSFKIKSSNRTSHIAATTADPSPQYVEVKGHTKLLSSFISLQSFWWLCLFSLFRRRSSEWPSTWREIPASLPCGWAGPRRLTTKLSSRYWDGDKYEDFFGQCLFSHPFSWIFEQGVGNFAKLLRSTQNILLIHLLRSEFNIEPRMAPGLQGSVELFAHEDENPTRFLLCAGKKVCSPLGGWRSSSLQFIHPLPIA